MPPQENNLFLTDQEKILLYKWIENGAEYEEHWAFIPPKKEKIPILNPGFIAINEIDNFIAEKLSEHNLIQSPLTDKERLLRRVTMDITGLPPTIKEIDDFLADTSENDYEKVVDRLLLSAEYGERMAQEWMDVSRYADSHGMHADGYRLMWPWRDWVIKAFNENQRYDQFVEWQIAGDMYPNATNDQKLATAFNRNHTMTAEGGVIDEEFRLSYVFDRTETFSTTFLGLTLGCARCHDHKFDPLSQKEYYQMTAFFNNVNELGMTGDDGNYGPMTPAVTPEISQKILDINKAISEQEEKINFTKNQILNISKFVQEIPSKENTKDRIFYGEFEKIEGKILDNNKNLTSSTTTEITDGFKGNAARLTGEYDELYIHEVNGFEANEPFSASLWVNTTKKDSTKTQTLMCTTGNKNSFWRGWEFYLDNNNRLNLKLINSLPHNYIQTRTQESIEINEWQNVSFTYDGSSKAKGIKLFINGKESPTEIVFDQLYKSILPIRTDNHIPVLQKPIRIGKSYRGFTGENGVFLGKIDEVKLFNAELSQLEIQLIAFPKNTNFSENVLSAFKIHQDKQVINEKSKLKDLVFQKIQLYNDISEVMVMEEMPISRKSYIYTRGEYLQPKEIVFPSTPQVLNNFSDDLPKNRLGLSNWLFDEKNPLTARVAVNRYWQMIFGKGIVESSNDFGLQGSRPSHPKLLDYLSVSFMEEGWNLKWLIKKMVMSYTYRQSSKLNEKDKEIDPSNKFLSRSPSYRLQAEMIRDNSLAASGLLVKKQGGESVKPYQPGDLWIEKSSFSHILLNYRQSQGDSLYRRSLYTFVRRTSPHPAMTIFDAPSREVCTIKRENTSTPLQALVLLNDPEFVEAARVMASRIQEEGGKSVEQQIQYAFRLTIGRKANSEELKLLEELYEKQARYFTKNPIEASKLLAVGESKDFVYENVSKSAALTLVASTIINHNEAYMKR